MSKLYRVTTVTKFPANLHVLHSRPLAQLRREQSPSMVTGQRSPLCSHHAMVENRRTARCLSLLRSTRYQSVGAIWTLMVVGRCARLGDGVQLAARRWSEVQHASAKPPFAALLDEPGHYIPRAHHTVYWARAMRGGLRGYKTE